MDKYIINNGIADKTYNGSYYAAGTVTKIQQELVFKTSQNEQLLSDILDNSVSISIDGVAATGDANNQIENLKGFTEDRDVTGRLVTRQAATIKGWGYLANFLEYTSSTGELFCNDFEGNSLASEFVVTRYDAGGLITTNPLNAVEDRVTWKPSYDFEIISGNIGQSELSLQDMRIYVAGGMFNAADNYSVIPGYYREFVRGVNLSLADKLQTDGRASKLLSFATAGAPFQTNMMQFRIKHGAGFTHKMIVSMEIFKQ